MIKAIQTENLAVGYRFRRARNIVLDDLNLSVRPGEMVCLLGTNGSGKSTLLRTLGGLQPILSGTIEIEGTDLRQFSRMELARRLGIVLTERLTVGALTVERVVELGRYPYWDWLGRMTPRDHDVVRWAIEAVAIEHLASKDSMSLSDGERQRLMIARALAQEPAILLLDEPTAFLDVPSRVELMGLLRRLARREQLAVIVSTHDLELALRMADTIWLISSERKMHTGTPEDIILDGTVADAFHAENIRFHPEERAFRLVNEARGRAVVEGEGLRATLAAAVLEREGYEIVAEGESPLRLTIASDGNQWEVDAGGCRYIGKDFATLAKLARSIGAEPDGMQ